MAARFRPPSYLLELERRYDEKMKEEERRKAIPPVPVDYDMSYAQFKDLLRPLTRIQDGDGAILQRRRVIVKILEPLKEIGQLVAESVKEGHSSKVEMFEAMMCLFGMCQKLTGLKRDMLKRLRPGGTFSRTKSGILQFISSYMAHVAHMYRWNEGKLFPFMRDTIDGWYHTFDRDGDGAGEEITAFGAILNFWNDVEEDPEDWDELSDNAKEQFDSFFSLSTEDEEMSRKRKRESDSDDEEGGEDEDDPEGDYPTLSIFLTLRRFRGRVFGLNLRLRNENWKMYSSTGLRILSFLGWEGGTFFCL
jgi:hypothetical protein